MNTDNNIPVQTNINPQDTGPVMPPVSEIQPPGKMKLSNLRIAVILIAVLILAGGAAFLATKANNQPEAPIMESQYTPEPPSPTSKNTGLNMAVSDDPEILEQELNDINMDNIDQELTTVDQDVNSL